MQRQRVSGLEDKDMICSEQKKVYNVILQN